MRIEIDIKKVGYVFLPLLFMVYIAIDTYLKINHSSLCHTKGCELAAGLIDINAIYLNILGIFDAFIILSFGFLTYKKYIDKKYFYFILLLSIVFETIMIGYQYFASPELCKFCLGVYTFLLLITLFTLYENILLFIGVISVIFMALYILAIPKQTPFILIDNVNYLIQSPTCPHCIKVKKFLRKNDIPFRQINITSIEARNFLKFLNFNTIPVLVKKNASKVQIINGDKDIIEFFESNNKLTLNNDKNRVEKVKLEDKAYDKIVSNTSLLDSTSEGSGCEVSIFEKPACSAKKKPIIK